MSDVLIAAELEYAGLPMRRGFDVWNKHGKLILRTEQGALVWKRKPAYFRVCETGKIYAVHSRERTEEIPAAAIRWKRTDAAPGRAKMRPSLRA
jgi:hypothetical protein